MMSDAEIEEAIIKLELGSLGRGELHALARLALLSLRATRVKLREYRDREAVRLVGERPDEHQEQIHR